MRKLSYKLIKDSTFSAIQDKIKLLETQIEDAKNFIHEIEKGNLSAALEITDADQATDSLASSLLNMRDQMKKIAEEEKQRNWIAEGLAKFVDILRTKNDDLKGLGDVIISNIVKYMEVNQGSLYILNDDNPADVHLEMIACYAYNRKKYLTKQIGLGEGMAGQAVLEKSTIYITNLPGDYLKISSGLGEALPRNLLIVPLILNEKVYGAIEMASFQLLQNHQREFIQRLAESIASTLSAVRVNQQTRKLLDETQAQTEQLRSQEEEMRQNMEELAATQEEMQRVMKETEGREAYVSQLLNVSTDLIYTVDTQYKLVSWNKAFARSLERFGMQLAKGVNSLDWYPEEERVKQIGLFNRALNGETFELTAASELNGATYHFLSIYSPLRDNQGNVYEVAVFAKDVTGMIEAQKRSEQLRLEAQNQTEELKAQEEELRQNMEELAATQEEMQRIMKETEDKEAYVSQLLNVSTDSIFTIDRQYRLVSWNQGLAKSLEGFGLRLEKGVDTLEWYSAEERGKQIELYNRVLKGETFEFTSPSVQNGSTYYFLSVYSPLRNHHGEVYEAAIFAKDVTRMTEAQQRSEQLHREAQDQTEILKAQEEVLRQNMEELSATQEEMQRILTEVQSKEEYLNAILNSAKDSIFTIDKDFRLISFNHGFSAGLTEMGFHVQKGFAVLDLFPDEKQKAEQRSHYKRAFQGEVFEVTSEFNFDGTITFYTSSFSPLRDANNEIFAVSVFGKDVTEMVMARKNAETLAAESQEKTEEMKAQEEELRQNMEELSATQEEMHRVMKEVEQKEVYVRQLLNVSNDMIYTIDPSFRLVSWNETFAASLEQYGIRMEKGMSTLDWYPTEAERKKQVGFYKRAFRGENFEVTVTSEINSSTHYFLNRHAPLKNEKGEIYEVAIFARDITASSVAK